MIVEGGMTEWMLDDGSYYILLTVKNDPVGPNPSITYIQTRCADDFITYAKTNDRRENDESCSLLL